MVFAVGAILVAVAYAVTLSAFSHETRARKTPFVAGNPALADGIVLDGKAVAVDPGTETAKVKLSFSPKGSVADTDGRLTKDLTVLVDTASGPEEKTYKAGELMRPAEYTLALTDGFQSDFPFDSYHEDLDILITRGAEAAPVPTVLDVFASVHGFSFSLQSEGAQADGGHFVTVTIRRSSATRFFAVFLIVVMWALTLGVLGLLFRVAALGRPIQFPMFAFMAALLFAFPAIRNTQPNAPPIGVRSDYLSFFWCEALVAISLITTLFLWVTQRRYNS